MNILKYCIKEVHNIEDVTEEYEKIVHRKLEQPALKITMTVDCYGTIEKVTQYFLKSDWEHNLRQGYYMA